MAKATTKAGPDYGDFQPVPDTVDYSLVYRSYGLDKVGKNHFGFTMPDPIFGLYFDPGGIKGVVQKFLNGESGYPKKDIRAIQYRFNKTNKDVQKAAEEVRDKFIEDYHTALKVARSIQWDETETWQVFRFAEFGTESARTREYGPLNGLYSGLIQDALDAGVNLQLIQKVKPKYKDDKPTEDYKPDGFQGAANIVQVSLDHKWDAEEGFVVTVVKSRQNSTIWGETYPALDFPQLGQLVYPDSSPEDWE